MNKYHFSVSIHFNCDYDVKNLENILKLKPYSITPYEKSVGDTKSAKFVYRTKVLNDIYTDDLFKQLVKKVEPHLKLLPEILKENDGRCVFRIVFDELKEKPCISLDNEILGILYKLNSNYEIVF